MILHDIATARAGDKGNTSQIAVIAKDDAAYGAIVEQVTSERVAAHFAGLFTGKITRHEAPALKALVFLIEGALGGGVSISLASDPHGKSFSSLILTMQIEE
jgi:putative Ca2+/H+ antiporter (TMEM165/GDT1 family)